MKNSNQERRDARHDNRSTTTVQSHEPRDRQGRFTDRDDQRSDDSRAYQEDNYGQENSYAGQHRESNHRNQFDRNQVGGRDEEQDQQGGFGKSLNINENSVRGENTSGNGTRGQRTSGYENQSRDRNHGSGSNGSTYGSQNNQGSQSNGSFFGGSTTGEHKGKGPKGYERSDERIQENINDQLSDDDQLDASEIEVKVEKGEVNLSGTVTAKSDKRRAEDIVEAIAGVKQVENHIRISSHGTSNSKSNGFGSTSNKSETAMSSGGSERTKNK